MSTLFSSSRLETGLGPDLKKSTCPLPSHVLLPEIIVACLPSGRILGYILLYAHRFVSYSLASPIRCVAPDKILGWLAFLSISVLCHSNSRVLIAALRADDAPMFCASLFSTALRFKEEHLLLDCSFTPVSSSTELQSSEFFPRSTHQRDRT